MPVGLKTVGDSVPSHLALLPPSAKEVRLASGVVALTSFCLRDCLLGLATMCYPSMQ